MSSTIGRSTCAMLALLAMAGPAQAANECRVEYGYHTGSGFNRQDQTETVNINAGETKQINRDNMNFVRNEKSHKVEVTLGNKSLTLNENNVDPPVSYYLAPTTLKSLECLTTVSEPAFGSPEQMTQALKQAGKTAAFIAEQLKTTFNRTNSQIAALLKGVGYTASQIAQALKDGVNATASQAAAALKAAGYTAVQVAAALKSAFNATAEQVAAALKSAFNATAEQVAAALEAAEYTAGQVAAALKSAFNATATQVAVALKGAGYAIDQVAAAVKSVFNATAEQVAAALQAAGYTAGQVAAAIKSAFNATAAQVAAALKAAGFAIDQVAAALKSAFNATAEQVAAALEAAGYTAEQVIAAIRASFNLTAQQAAAALEAAGFTVAQVAAALIAGYGATVEQVASALKAAGYTLDEVARALRDAFRQMARDALDAALRAAGWTAREIAGVLDTLYGAAEQALAPEYSFAYHGSSGRGPSSCYYPSGATPYAGQGVSEPLPLPVGRSVAPYVVTFFGKRNMNVVSSLSSLPSGIRPEIVSSGNCHVEVRFNASGSTVAADITGTGRLNYGRAESIGFAWRTGPVPSSTGRTGTGGGAVIGGGSVGTRPAQPAAEPDLLPSFSGTLLRHIGNNRRISESFCQNLPTSRSATADDAGIVSVPNLSWGVINSANVATGNGFNIELRANGQTLRPEQVGALPAGGSGDFTYARPQSQTRVIRVRGFDRTSGAQYGPPGCYQELMAANDPMDWQDPPYEVRVDTANAVSEGAGGETNNTAQY